MQPFMRVIVMLPRQWEQIFPLDIVEKGLGCYSARFRAVNVSGKATIR